MQKKLLTACAAAGVLSIVPAAGADVLITEFMANPSGTDTEREWLEIYNSGDTAVDLSNYKIGTSETPLDGEDMSQFPAGSFIEPGQVMVIAVNAAAFLDWTGVQASFEAVDTDPNVPDLLPYETWSGNPNAVLTIANSEDQILLLGENDEILDATAHGGTWGDFNLAQLGNNESWERVPAGVDTDTAADWVLRLDGEATPGVVTTTPVPEPASVGLVAAGGLVMLRRRRM